MKYEKFNAKLSSLKIAEKNCLKFIFMKCPIIGWIITFIGIPLALLAAMFFCIYILVLPIFGLFCAI